jgi:hypothetical protein
MRTTTRILLAVLAIAFLEGRRGCLETSGGMLELPSETSTSPTSSASPR